MRRRLPWLVAGWLLCQLAAFASAPVELAAHGFAARDVCDCPGAAPGQACPMHRSPNADRRGSDGPVLHNGCAPLDAALLSLVGGLGLLPAAGLAGPNLVPAPLPPASDTAVSRADLPDAPPPRA